MPRSVLSTAVKLSMLVPFSLKFSGNSLTVSQMCIMNFHHFYDPPYPSLIPTKTLLSNMPLSYGGFSCLCPTEFNLGNHITSHPPVTTKCQ